MPKLIDTGQTAAGFYDPKHKVNVFRPTVYVLKGERQKCWDLSDAAVQNVRALFPFALAYCRHPRCEINGYVGSALEVHAPKITAIAKMLPLHSRNISEAQKKLDELAQALWKVGHPLDPKELRKPLASTTPSFFSW